MRAKESINKLALKMIKSHAVEEARFDQSQIDRLRAEYDTINGIDPDSPSYNKLITMLDNMDDDMLVQLMKANIKFVSGLARNRVVRRGLI